MRSIKHIHRAVYAPIDDLITYRAMPTHSIEYIDPFLFLNHHGPQTYGPNNNGLPFGPHPHRGFETLTYVMKGDIVHWDSGGSKSVIREGGVQWMTAGSGLIHSEVSSEEFKQKGGEEEVIQLWLNLPARHKMTDPKYHGLTYEDIVHIRPEGSAATVNLISGKWGEHRGPVLSLGGLTMASIEMKSGGSLEISVPPKHQILFYVAKGAVEVNGREARMHELVEFEQDHEKIRIRAGEDAYLVFGHGEPFNEPVVAQGPFVMNTTEEISQAYRDFRSGKMGTWDQ